MPADIGQPLIELLPRMRRYALVLCRDSHLADDLVQATCERALATTSGPGDSVPFDAWIFTIARNIWIDRGRTLQRQGASDDIDDHLDAAVAPNLQGELQARDELQHVSRAIEQLPAEQREVLLLVCVEELSYQQAAEVLGVPLGTVMSRLSRARLKLVAQFKRGIVAPRTDRDGVA